MDTTFASTAREFTPDGWQRETDKLLAKLVVVRGLASVEQVQECLREMKQAGEASLNLGQMLVKKRLLDPRIFSEVYRSQREMPFYCRPCQKKYTLPELSARKSFCCPLCHGKLEEPEHLQKVVLENLLAGTESRPLELGNYTVLQEIARGGMGVVYKARHKDMSRVVALKVMRDVDTADPDALARFQREISVCGKLQHANIVNIFDAGQAGTTLYFTMEYIDGMPLDKKIKAACYKSKDAAQLIESVARAVHYAHRQQIVHRDLKPANILLDQQGEPHIVDFGLAKDLARNTRLTHTGSAMGTPFYMAPEQIEGKQCGPSVDIYALGVVLYEMVTQTQPFSGSSQAELYCKILTQPPTPPCQVNPSIPAELEAIILKAMMKSPHERYANAKALADDLQRFRQGRATSARPLPRWLRRMQEWRQHLPWIVAGSCVLLLLLAMFAMVWKGDSAAVRDVPSQEIERRVQEAKELWRQKQSDAARHKAEQIWSAYPDSGRTLVLVALSALAYEEAGDIAKALTDWQRLYVESVQASERIGAARGIMRCALRARQFPRAALALQSVLAISPQLDDGSTALGAQVYFHAGEWEKSQALFTRLDSLRRSTQADDREVAQRRWLKVLLPVQSCAASGGLLRVLPVKLSDGGDCLLGVTQPEQIQLYAKTENGLRRVASLPAPDGFRFGNILVAANVKGGARPELLANVSHLQKNEKSLLVYAFKNGRFVPEATIDLDNDPHQVWAGELTHGQRAILVTMGYPKRNVSVYLQETEKNGKWKRRDLDTSLRETNTDALSIDAADLDGDGVCEIILGTSAWTFYDVRVYACGDKFTEFSLRAHKRLGIVSDCKAFDMDGDQRPEILACKQFTHNSVVFGNAAPHGEPDGLYVFRWQSRQLEELWRYTFPATGQPRRGIGSINVGKLKNGLGAAVVHMSETMVYKRGGRELVDSEQEIWLVDHCDGRYQALPFASANARICGCGLGDVDGDGHHELVILKEGQLSVCGMSK